MKRWRPGFRSAAWCFVGTGTWIHFASFTRAKSRISGMRRSPLHPGWSRPARQMNLLGAAILGILIAVVLFASRRWAVIAMMTGVLYLTQGQAVQVMGLNMFAVRFLELAGFV